MLKEQTDFKPFRQFDPTGPSWTGIAYKDLAKPLGLSEDNITEVSSTLTNVTVLGVGTSSPSTTLEVASQTSPQFTIRYDTTNSVLFGCDSAGLLALSPSGNKTEVRNSTNAQALHVYNTYTAGTPDYERLSIDWSLSSNVCIISTTKNGTGTSRNITFRYGGTGTSALTITPTLNGGCFVGGSNTSGAFATGLFCVGTGTTYSALSGTCALLTTSATFSDGGSTSSTAVIGLQQNPTINYTAASKTGKVYLQYLNPTLTSLPSGNSAGISFSSAFTNASFSALRFWNTADEVTDTESFEQGWHIVANEYCFRTANSGAGAQRNCSWLYRGSGTAAIKVAGTGATAAADHIAIGALSVTATSGTENAVALNARFQPTATSTMVASALKVAPTVNYSAGTPGAGKVYGIYIAPTLTAQPTGNNAGLAFSSAFTSSTFPAILAYNTADEDTNYERFEEGWHLVANQYSFRTGKGGTGTGRPLALLIGATTSFGVSVGSTIGAGVGLAGYNLGTTAATTGRVRIGAAGNCTATSGTSYELLIDSAFNPTSTSTMAGRAIAWTGTVNYSAGTPGAGSVYGIYLNPTNTALPTGLSAAIALSSTSSTLGGIKYYNQTDETTNYEYVQEGFQSNIFVISSVKGGTGTLRGIQIGVTSNAVGFMGATPVTRPSTTGETVGFTAGAGTNVTDASTFTGNVGSTAYRLSDIVKHLKNLGLIAQ